MEINVDCLSAEEKRTLIKERRRGLYCGEQHGNYWSKEDDERLSHLFGEGYDYSEIGLIMGRGDTAIINRCEKLKLRLRTRRPYHKSRSDGCLCSQCSLIATCEKAKGNHIVEACPLSANR